MQGIHRTHYIAWEFRQNKRFVSVKQPRQCDGTKDITKGSQFTTDVN